MSDTRRDDLRQFASARGTASIAGLRGFVIAAGYSPSDPGLAALLSRHGVNPRLIGDTDARIPYRAHLAILSDLAARDGNEDLGLRAGALGRWGFAGEYVMQQSPTLIEAFRRFVPYARLVASPVQLGIERRDAGFAVVGSFPMEAVPGAPPDLVRHGIDIWLASFVSFGRRLTGTAWAPLAVRVRYLEPPSTRSLEEFFRAPIEFGAPINELLLAESVAELPLEPGDPDLARMIEQHCDALLARLPTDGETVSALLESIPELLRGGDFNIARTARLLGMAPRTLQRRLSAEGRRYSEVIDGVRRTLALGYLSNPSMSTDEIAALLGYSERRAFLRAFKRWTGSTPGKVRSELGEAAK